MLNMPDNARCLQCGYLLRGLREPRCPECGRVFAPEDPATYATTPRRSRWLAAARIAVYAVNALLVPVSPVLGLVGSLADTSPGENRWWLFMGFWLMSVTAINLGVLLCARRCPGYVLLLVFANNAALLVAGIHNAVQQLWLWGFGAVSIGFLVELTVPLVVAVGTPAVLVLERRRSSDRADG
jgi:hypothetical protein